MESYEDIVKRMEDAYREESGQEVEAVSDLGLRLRVLAGELYRLQAGMDWLWRQAFPQTATGEQLDRHGAQRGLARREASHAQGELTFSRYLALDFDLVIPAGTLCAAPGEEAVEYETLEEGVLPAGELTVDIPAQAVLGGSGGNAAAGYISTLVTPVTGIDYVTNEAAFTGGRDPEEDEAYRARVLGAYQRCATTGNAGFYESAALAVPGITTVQVVPRASGAGTVAVFAWGEGAAPPAAVLEALEADLQAQREIGVTVTVAAATPLPVNVSANVRPRAGADFTAVKTAVEDALAQWFAGLGVASPVTLADLSRVILGAAPIDRLEFAVNMQDIGSLTGVIPVEGTVQIGEIA